MTTNDVDVDSDGCDEREARVLLMEPFYGGSHAQLIDTLRSWLGTKSAEMLTLPATKWHWRARTSALIFAQQIDKRQKYSHLFCSSVLNLAELIALCPQLQKAVKIVYFHENQLDYPVQSTKDRDFQFGYNQILTSLVADILLFNSAYNMESFLSHIRCHLKFMPDFRPDSDAIRSQIQPKCRVLYFPIEFLPLNSNNSLRENDGLDRNHLHIIWPHRWEHDKDPTTFFQVLYELVESGTSNFRLSVLGENYNEKPEIFAEARQRLDQQIAHWGFVESKSQYYDVLKSGHVVVSTSKHEFFGVAMLEAAHLGCYPLCPNDLVYPEIFPSQCLYNTTKQLVKRLRTYCDNLELLRQDRADLRLNTEQFSAERLRPKYLELFE